MALLEIDATELAKRMTIHVTVTKVRRLRFRLALASVFFNIAALIVGCSVNVTEGE